jgi:hypothetical protein
MFQWQRSPAEDIQEKGFIELGKDFRDHQQQEADRPAGIGSYMLPYPTPKIIAKEQIGIKNPILSGWR